MAILDRLHARWRLAIMVPLGYMMVGMVVWKWAFPDGRGLLPLGEGPRLVLLFGAGLSVAFLWLLLLKLTQRQYGILAEARSDPNNFLRAARNAQLRQFMVCDLAASPGIVFFLLDADIFLLGAFSASSLVFYLRAIPSGRRLGEALLLAGRSAGAR